MCGWEDGDVRENEMKWNGMDCWRKKKTKIGLSFWVLGINSTPPPFHLYPYSFASLLFPQNLASPPRFPSPIPQKNTQQLSRNRMPPSRKNDRGSAEKQREGLSFHGCILLPFGARDPKHVVASVFFPAKGKEEVALVSDGEILENGLGMGGWGGI